MKPNGVDVYLLYVCPKCNAQHTASREETIFPGGVLCYCGEKIKFEPVETINVKLNYGQHRTKTNVTKPKNIDKTDVINCLVGLGYNRAYIRSRVSELSNMNDEQIIMTITKEKVK